MFVPGTARLSHLCALGPFPDAPHTHTLPVPDRALRQKGQRTHLEQQPERAQTTESGGSVQPSLRARSQDASCHSARTALLSTGLRVSLGSHTRQQSQRPSGAPCTLQRWHGALTKCEFSEVLLGGHGPQCRSRASTKETRVDVSCINNVHVPAWRAQP